MSQAIDRKQLKNKYRKAVEDGITQTFSNLYPHNKIIIKYEKDHGDYYFLVYINGETLAKQDIPLVVDHDIFVDKFINHLAIKLFSDIAYNEYVKVYDDYKPENYTWLKDELEKLQTEYEAKGIIFEDLVIEQSNWRIICYHPNGEKDPYYRPDSTWGFHKKQNNPEVQRWKNSGYFSIYPISLGTAKTVLSKCKSTMKHALKSKIEFDVINEGEGD